MSTVKLKAGDDLPEIQATLTGSDGTAVDLTGSTVQFRFRPADGGTSTTGNATVITPASGTVKYVWGAGDTDTPGWYVGEWIVTTTGGSVMTFPGEDYISFQIVDTLQ